jgi:ammonia channel protein AmtB
MDHLGLHFHKLGIGRLGWFHYGYTMASKTDHSDWVQDGEDRWLYLTVNKEPYSFAAWTWVFIFMQYKFVFTGVWSTEKRKKRS